MTDVLIYRAHRDRHSGIRWPSTHQGDRPAPSMAHSSLLSSSRPPLPSSLGCAGVLWRLHLFFSWNLPSKPCENVSTCKQAHGFLPAGNNFLCRWTSSAVCVSLIAALMPIFCFINISIYVSLHLLAVNVWRAKEKSGSLLCPHGA